jgi:hypothetical protein
MLARVAAMSIVTACGAFAAEPRDASVDATDDATFDAADALVDAACATPCSNDAPQPGTPCSGSSRICEYESLDAGCREPFACSAGTWITGSIYTTCDRADASRCGASLAETEGTACDPYSRCDFDGAVCICGKKTFVCEHATPGCPVPRPLLGTACAQDDTPCTSYLDLGCGPNITCRNCIWTAEYLHTCP